MYIELFGRGDRLGANITTFIAQICYAVNNNLFILYNKNNIKDGDNINFVPYNQNYNNSIFILSLFYFIDEHNNYLLKQGYSYGELNNIFTIHWFEMMSKVLININIDYYTFFKIHIYPKIYNFYINYTIKNGYVNLVPFNKDKTILVHLRLGDCRYAPDYDGIHCATYFKNKINNKLIVNNNTHNEIKQYYPNNNFQAPLSFNKINNQIDILLQKYPDYEVVLLTNPGENLSNYKYKYISNNDESLDLYLLSLCNVVILSRSTFSLSSLFFNYDKKDVYIPLWGHIPCLGLYTNYDNTNYTYF